VSSATTEEVVFRVCVLQRRSSCVRYITKLYSSSLPSYILHVLSCLRVQLATKMSKCIVGEDKYSCRERGDLSGVLIWKQNRSDCR
jgi:hypothetical protein